jgi:hypothetical protein
MVLLHRLGLRISVSGYTGGWLAGVDRSHGSSAFLGCFELVLLLPPETAKEEEAEECETHDGSDDSSRNPSFGASTAITIAGCAK